MKSTFAAALLVLLATPLLADADLSITNDLNVSVVRAGTSRSVDYVIHNAGPDTTSNVIVTLTVAGATVSTPCSGGCAIGDIPARSNGFLSEVLSFPATAGDVTMTATVTSSVPDPNGANNSITSVLTVSTDPDVTVSVSASQTLKGLTNSTRLELALPFVLGIYLGNVSQSVAHGVDVTVDYRADTGVQTLPAGCTSPMPGRITCHADSLAANGFQHFLVTLIAPPIVGSGSIIFAATATEQEQDFDPSSNMATSVSQLYNTFYVTSTGGDGTGSLREAIIDANAFCLGSALCAIAFRIEEPSANGWKTIPITSPLPALTASNIRIDGATQGGFSGDPNPDGPDIEISGGGTVDGDGLTLEGCVAEVANLAINGFQRNGVSVVDAHHSATCTPYPELHHLFIGTDPTGSEARPNGQRGIGISIPSGSAFGYVLGGANIHECLVSGNTLSGIFGLSGFLYVWGNRIGVKAHSDEPLPNGASGIFIGPGGYGSAIGSDIITPTLPGNVIAFNRQMGVAIAASVKTVSVRGNRIWGNGGLGIDIGLDGSTISTTSENGIVVAAPTLTLAHYDPVSRKTIIEGETSVPHPQQSAPELYPIDLYANDAADPSGFGQGQRPIGTTRNANFTSTTHFHIEVDGDLTGQFITTTATNVYYVGFAKPEGIDQGFLTQTSEFSRAIEVR